MAFIRISAYQERCVVYLLIVSPYLLFDSVQVGVLLHLPGHSLDEGEEVPGYREQGQLEPPRRAVDRVGVEGGEVMVGGRRGEVHPEHSSLGGEQGGLGDGLAGGEDLPVLTVPDGEGVATAGGQGQVGQEEQETAPLPRLYPPVAGRQQGVGTGVVRGLHDSQAWPRPVHAV